MSKPKLFIGSSNEGLSIANAIHSNLEHDSEITIWNQDVFKLSIPIISNLVKSLKKFDFAIFVFTPDDISNIRGDVNNAVRDNIIFETGLFAGYLGIENVYLVRPRGEKMHLPSDMLGIVIGEYDSNRSDKNLIAATGPFCNQVRILITQEKVIKNSQGEIDYKKDLQIIVSYLNDKNWTQIRLRKIIENINPKYNEEYILRLIEEFPTVIRRAKINKEFGIKLLYVEKEEDKLSEKINYYPYTRLIIKIEVTIQENFEIIQEKVKSTNADFHFSYINHIDNYFEIHCPQHLTNESLIIFKLRDLLNEFRLKEISIYHSANRTNVEKFA